jgi:pSer/pThr/pTyr-binding forkhead associated (FHA) protein
MEQFLDLLFAVRWWQWLLGTGCVAGLYYLVATFFVPHLRHMHELAIEELETQRQEEEDQEREKQRQERMTARREYLKAIPSGPVEPVALPEAVIRVRNRYVPVPRDAELTFGAKRGVSVQLVKRGVSGEHAKIRPEPEGYVLYDLMSTTGTRVAGEKVERKSLRDGDRIQIGPVEILFKLGRPGDGD